MRATLPTTDLYFLNSCRIWVQNWWRNAPITRVGPNSFHCNNRFLLIRRDEPELMERALKWPGVLIYLIDDDIDGAAQSPGLPGPYRDRLRLLARDHYDRLLRRADVIVTSSDALALRLTQDKRVSGEIARLDPFWTLPLADRRHFKRSGSGTLEIVHLGTASHAGGLAKIVPAIVNTLTHHSRARLTIIGNRNVHPSLDRHPRVRIIKPMRWPQYQHWLQQKRFHIGLYPLEDTPFDQARSINKIIEHAIVGAVGIYRDDWEPALMLHEGAISAPADLRLWETCIRNAIENVDLLEAKAASAAATVRELQLRSAQLRFWSQLLKLEGYVG